jgi:hypothetical protein
VAAARDVPLPRPQFLVVGAALQKQFPSALAVDPHVRRPVVVVVPVHLQPEKNEAKAAASDAEAHNPIEGIRKSTTWDGGAPWFGDAGLLPGFVEDVEALLRRSSHLDGAAGGDRAGATSGKAKC